MALTPTLVIFLGTPELLTIYIAFIRSLMEYCSPLWGDDPASHLAQPHAVETKAFRIIGISHDEAESSGLSLSHHRQVGGLCLLPSPPPCSVCYLCVCTGFAGARTKLTPRPMVRGPVVEVSTFNLSSILLCPRG